MKPEDGWLGDRSTVDGNYATIAAWAEYKGDRSAAAWFPDRAVAHVWRAWESKDAPVTLDAATADGAKKLPPWGPKVARDLMVDPGTDLVLSASVKPGTTVSKVAFYNVDARIGDAAVDGSGWRFTWKGPAPGFHVVYARWETADGKPGVGNPALVIVRIK